MSEKSEKYQQLRLIIYSLLSYESSLLSQQVITIIIITITKTIITIIPILLLDTIKLTQSN